MRLPLPALALLPILAAAPACTPPPTQELALADMVPRGDARAVDAPLSTVYFEVGSAMLTNEAEAVLGQLAGDPSAGRWTRVTLAGHADRSGPARLNRRLSTARVDAVRSRLIALGVPAAIIVTAAVGERQARTGAAAEDRRVDIFVTG
ncbi:MAG: OmpA family protein [Sphingomonadaceae bacterium]|nr:OmpA family protein [Sphingomonadaceae bacterium]